MPGYYAARGQVNSPAAALLGWHPLLGRKNIDQDETERFGLEDIQVNRLKSAIERLIAIQTRANQRPYRNFAMLLLLHTALRESEMLRLQFPKQYRGVYLHDIKRKGEKVTKKLKVPTPARDAIEKYFGHKRGRASGPMFQTKNGQQLAAPNPDDALKALAVQANST